MRTGLAVIAALAVATLFAETGEVSFVEGHLAVTFKNGWPVSVLRNGKTVLARSTRVLNYEI